jgi:hypothetical protein
VTLWKTADIPAWDRALKLAAKELSPFDAASKLNGIPFAAWSTSLRGKGSKGWQTTFRIRPIKSDWHGKG